MRRAHWSRERAQENASAGRGNGGQQAAARREQDRRPRIKNGGAAKRRNARTGCHASALLSPLLRARRRVQSRRDKVIGLQCNNTRRGAQPPRATHPPALLGCAAPTRWLAAWPALPPFFSAPSPPAPAAASLPHHSPYSPSRLAETPSRPIRSRCCKHYRDQPKTLTDPRAAATGAYAPFVVHRPSSVATPRLRRRARQARRSPLRLPSTLLRTSQSGEPVPLHI